MARLAIRLECVGLSACAVERAHQLSLQTFVQRVPSDEGLELRNQLGMATRGELAVDDLFDRGQVLLFEPAPLLVPEAFVVELHERRPAPECKGFLVPSFSSELLEEVKIELAVAEPEQIARAHCHQAVVPELRTTLNLKLDIRIPDEYLPDFNQRLSLYKSISSAQDRDELERIQSETRDQYGQIPPQGETLFTLAKLKLLAEKLRVASIEYAQQRVLVRFAPDSPVPPERLLSAITRSAGMSLSPEGVVRMQVGAHEEQRLMAVRELLKGLL